MKIGEAAAAAGLEPSAIRFYEKQGVLPRPARTEAGYRRYDADDVALLRLVRGARRLGVPLDDVKEIVALRVRGEAPCAVVRHAMAREAEMIDTRIGELQALRQELLRLQEQADRLADDWPSGSCVCHIVEGENPPVTKRKAPR
ncbi:MAG: MerR family transcriptional regulator [Acidimicrobiia bacterium]|nr:MAG: MerR family transcriptional regulator [Acidimicrobiia bacterium]